MQESHGIQGSTAASGDGLLRLGGIDYLNALPLLWGLGEAEDGMSMGYHVPSRLAEMLEVAELDVALIPVVASIASPDYRVVPGIGISSYGGVRSIRLYYRESLSSVKRVGLDTCSMTSALLTRLLFREVWGAEPEFIPCDPASMKDYLAGGVDELSGLDAVLLIGDAALAGGRYADWLDTDLGTEWTRWTGLPFVYAFWACRQEAVAAASVQGFLIERLARAKEAGLLRIDEIVAGADLPADFDVAAGIHYLGSLIDYDLGEDKLEAMKLFFDRLYGAGLLDSPAGELSFVGG